jgi:hypothetical protein
MVDDAMPLAEASERSTCDQSAEGAAKEAPTASEKTAGGRYIITAHVILIPWRPA